MQGLIIMAVLAMAMALWLARLQRADATSRFDRAWRQAARELGGTITPAHRPRAIACRIAGHDVTIETQPSALRPWAHRTSDRLGHGDDTHTRVRARARVPRELSLRIYHVGAFGWLARAVGVEDVEVGDEVFDRAFIVQSSDPELARLWVHEDVRRRITAAADYAFSIKKGVVTASREAVEDDPEALVAAARAVASLADARAAVLDVWKTAANVHGGRVEPVAERWARLAVEIDDVPVIADTREVSGAHYTVVEAQKVAQERMPFALSRERHIYGSGLPMAEDAEIPSGYTLWAEWPREAMASLDGESRFLIDDLTPAKLSVDGARATVLVRGVVTEPRVLEQAIRLAARLVGAEGLGSIADGA